MSMRKIGFAEMAAAILGRLRKETGYPCYDAVPDNAPSPFLFVEVISKKDSSSKTMFKEILQANIHVIASPGDARLELYRMTQDVEEALTDDLELPDPITLVLQTETGVNATQQDETGEWHGVMGYEFTVSYGFKVK